MQSRHLIRQKPPTAVNWQKAKRVRRRESAASQNTGFIYSQCGISKNTLHESNWNVDFKLFTGLTVKVCLAFIWVWGCERINPSVWEPLREAAGAKGRLDEVEAFYLACPPSSWRLSSDGADRKVKTDRRLPTSDSPGENNQLPWLTASAPLIRARTEPHWEPASTQIKAELADKWKISVFNDVTRGFCEKQIRKLRTSWSKRVNLS